MRTVYAFLLFVLVPAQALAQSGRVNYFHGKDSRFWLRDLPAPASFHRPTHIAPSAIGTPGLDYATFFGGSSGNHAAAITTDVSGNIYIAGSTSSKDFPVTSDAFQGTLSPPLSSVEDAFVAKFSPQGQLVYCTYFGGSGDDQALALAVDRYGSAYVAGETTSTNFPTSTGVILESPTINAGSSYYAFVTKLNSAGNAILYSTLLSTGSVRGIAADDSQDAFVTGVASAVIPFPVTPGAISTVQTGGAFLAGINPAGSRYLYATGLQYASDVPTAVAIDTAGSAYVTGSTTSLAIRAGNAFQPVNAVRTLSITSDAAAHWRVPGPGLEGLVVNDLEVDGKTATIYAATGSGLFKSADGGNSWSLILNGQVYRVAVDPGNSNHLLALFWVASVSGYVVYGTQDGGSSWTSTGSPPFFNIVFDPNQPSNVYAATNAICYYSHDGGLTFTQGRGPNSNGVKLYPDPFNLNRLYATAQSGLYVTLDAGASWQLRYGSQFLAFAVDPANPNVVYGFRYPMSAGGLSKSTDGGSTWTATATNLIPSFLAFDPTDKTTLYAIVSTTTGPNFVYRSVDQGTTFQPLPALPVNPTVTSLTFDPQHSGTQYAISALGSDAFVSKVSPDGGTLLFSTYLGGGATDTATGIALDASGNIYVAGNTNSADLNGAANSLAGGTDAFIAKLSNDGARLAFSRFVGGSGNDTANGIALDSAGDVYIAGSTFSSNFPLTSDALETVFPAKPPASSTGYIAPFIGFYTRMDNSGTILSSSFIGGAEGDTPYAVAVDPSGRLCIAGDTNSPDMTTTSAAAQPSQKGNTDAFLMILDFGDNTSFQ